MERETKLLIGGIVIAGIGFFVPLYFGKIWIALFIALLTGIIFLGRLVSLSKDEFESKTTYRVVYGLVILVVLFNAIAFANDYGNRDFQKDLLLEIRKVIDEGVTKADVQEKLVYVLSQYHQNDRESIVATFRELMPEQLGDDGVFVSDHDLRTAEYADDQKKEDDNRNHFYEIDEEEDEIRVFVVGEVSLGEDPEYENYDGQKGQFEMIFTLNKEGVHYEVLN
ncbi:MAG: hypothetical protein HUJ22_08900 [Gracilimonas sp.]|uniref:hypothetical protein n=1 Tax=Gracilimonas sp. TaxID=1974203 RepID=UPI0019AB9604|nr:hypothetical protein [Gracilimonas sp.]MBD3616679.1 hypothetical protein [Gracilimonas sp.]